MTAVGDDRRSARIDVLRGIAILLVLLHHFNIAYRLEDTLLARAMGWEAVRALVRNGNYGVTMFFVISGFLITSNAKRRWGALEKIRPLEFYGMRVARIVPCLLLLLVVVNLLAWAGIAIFQNRPGSGAPISLWLVNLASLTFWMNVLLDRYGWVNYALGVLWSLSVEEVFYLCFPILCVAMRQERRLLLFWTTLIAFAPVYRLMHQGDEAGFLYAYFASFDGIAVGCCMALLAERVTLTARARGLLQIGTAASMVFLYLYWPISQSNVLGVTAMSFGTAILLLGTSDRSGGETSTRMGLGRAFEWLGRRSYELYLFHLVLLGGLRTMFPPRLADGDEKMFLLSAFLILTLGVGEGIARFYSEPLNSRIRRRIAASNPMRGTGDPASSLKN